MDTKSLKINSESWKQLPSDEGNADLEMRYGSRNRDCPMNDKTTLKGVGSPCIALPGVWRDTWEECGTACTQDPSCTAWTFNKRWCSLYKDSDQQCTFDEKNGKDVIAGYSGCEGI